MDMNMNTTMTNDTQADMMTMMMIPFLHFTGGDHLLFEAWQPTSPGAIGGACVGIFFFAIFERWVHAISPVLIHYLVQRRSRNAIQPSEDQPSSPHLNLKGSDISLKEKGELSPRATRSFSVSVDIPRGMIYAFRRLLGCALMLTFMTFNVGYILSVIAGWSIGEILFGRVPYEPVKHD